MSFFGANTSLGATSTPAKTTGGLFGSPFGGTAATSQPAPAFGAQATSTPTFGAQPATSAFGAGSAFGATAAAPAFGAATGTSAFGGSAFGSAPAFGAATPQQRARVWEEAVLADLEQLRQQVRPVCSALQRLVQHHQLLADSANRQLRVQRQQVDFPALAHPQRRLLLLEALAPTSPLALGAEPSDLPQQQPAPISADEAFAQSILNVSIFGDERDKIVAKWNYLQATWGTGKMFYSQSAAPVDITPENVMCRFKAIGYSRMPGKDNKLGLVALNFCRELSAVKPHQQQVIQTLHSLFGSKPNMLVHIDSIKELENKKCQMVIYVEEKLQHPPNESKRILATDLSSYLNQASLKPQLNNLGVVESLALVLPDEDQLREYLENPPRGVDPRMWRQANSDNPDPTIYIPVPMVGFSDLKWRVKCQEQETDTHALYIKKVEGELTELKKRHATATAKILEHKRKLAELGHRILRIIVKQECTRKVGTSLTPEEEAMRTKLQNMLAVVSAPTQFKGRLSELLSQMRMQRNQFAANGGAEYALDKESEDEMKTFLSMQQRAMEVLSDTVNKDLRALDVIIKGLPELRQS
ncbi:GM20361 [Drosophila sechellia]|uniref:GM20361 n=1 Tax=Drosophila sechellia TaxID=7238 RepID=B4HPI8_DROSE|nr:GM20361 [Drosophila sechellia]